MSIARAFGRLTDTIGTASSIFLKKGSDAFDWAATMRKPLSSRMQDVLKRARGIETRSLTQALRTSLGDTVSKISGVTVFVARSDAVPENTTDVLELASDVDLVKANVTNMRNADAKQLRTLLEDTVSTDLVPTKLSLTGDQTTGLSILKKALAGMEESTRSGLIREIGTATKRVKDLSTELSGWGVDGVDDAFALTVVDGKLLISGHTSAGELATRTLSAMVVSNAAVTFDALRKLRKLSPADVKEMGVKVARGKLGNAIGDAELEKIADEFDPREYVLTGGKGYKKGGFTLTADGSSSKAPRLYPNRAAWKRPLDFGLRVCNGGNMCKNMAGALALGGIGSAVAMLGINFMQCGKLSLAPSACDAAGPVADTVDAWDDAYSQLADTSAQTCFSYCMPTNFDHVYPRSYPDEPAYQTFGALVEQIRANDCANGGCDQEALAALADPARSALADQPFCSASEDEPRGDGCRDFCVQACTATPADYQKLLEQLYTEADDRTNDIVSSAGLIILGVVVAIAVVAYMVFGGGKSDADYEKELFDDVDAPAAATAEAP